MFLSRIEMDLSRISTKRALASPQIIHAAVQTCFPEEAGRILWRLDNFEGKMFLLTISPTKPDFAGFAQQFGGTGEVKEYTPLLEQIKNGQRLSFRFRANPTYTKSAGKGNRGKIYAHVTISQKRTWLMEKSAKWGFSLAENDFDVVETDNLRFYKDGNKKAVELGVATFEGHLSITDVQLFKKALIEGIGRAKAYGCGMITVAKPR